MSAKDLIIKQSDNIANKPTIYSLLGILWVLLGFFGFGIGVVSIVRDMGRRLDASSLISCLFLLAIDLVALAVGYLLLRPLTAKTFNLAQKSSIALSFFIGIYCLFFLLMAPFDILALDVTCYAGIALFVVHLLIVVVYYD